MSLARDSRHESGMTLVELMLALVVSSLVVSFLFSIQSKMSRAYQAQSTISEINQNIQTARQLLAREIRMAGFGLANTGTNTAVSVADGVDASGFLQGFTVFNNAYGDGNDSFRILYSEPVDEIVVEKLGPVYADTYEPPPSFAAGEPIIIAARSAACLVAVTGTNPNKIHFNATPVGKPYNDAPQNMHCQSVRDALNGGQPVTIQRFIARSYRIDPTRPGEAFLQMSPSGEVIPDDWLDVGVGFTNLQLATRYFEAGDVDDTDGDGDAERDWYSSDNQVRPTGSVLLQVSLSIEVRSPYGTRGAAASPATPAFIDMAKVDNNAIGDWGQACPDSATDPCGVDLVNTPDASRPARYQGEYIYRYSSTRIDLRNMGVGR